MRILNLMKNPTTGEQKFYSISCADPLVEDMISATTAISQQENSLNVMYNVMYLDGLPVVNFIYRKDGSAFSQIPQTILNDFLPKVLPRYLPCISSRTSETIQGHSAGKLFSLVQRKMEALQAKERTPHLEFGFACAIVYEHRGKLAIATASAEKNHISIANMPAYYGQDEEEKDESVGYSNPDCYTTALSITQNHSIIISTPESAVRNFSEREATIIVTLPSPQQREALTRHAEQRMQLEIYKEQIIESLEAYGNQNRFLHWRHHHRNRCFAVCDAIKQSEQLDTILLILHNQSEICGTTAETKDTPMQYPVNERYILEARWTEKSMLDRFMTRNSSYKTVIDAALNVKQPGQENSAVHYPNAGPS